MRLARIDTPDGIKQGPINDGAVESDGERYEIGPDGTLAAPCTPTSIYCVGRNYTATLDQMAYDRPDEPDFFIKPPGSIAAHREKISYPSFTEELTYAGELAAVIGERCHRLAYGEAESVIRGYTIMNDLDALDQQGRTARKAFVGSGPLGPWIQTDIDPTAIEMHTEINGDRRQESNTELMLFDPFEIVSYLSERFVFEPGDVIAFGSPANPGTVEPDDTIEITYDGVGTLSNTIVEPAGSAVSWKK